MKNLIWTLLLTVVSSVLLELPRLLEPPTRPPSGAKIYLDMVRELEGQIPNDQFLRLLTKGIEMRTEELREVCRQGDALGL